METTNQYQPGAPLLTRLRYRWQGEERMRCFHIRDGEPVATDCPPKFTGLGDLVADGTRALGVQPCGGCKQRQAALNRWTPAWAARLISRIRSR